METSTPASRAISLMVISVRKRLQVSLAEVGNDVNPDWSDGGKDLRGFVERIAVLWEQVVAQVGEECAAVLLDLAFVEGEEDLRMVGSEGLDGPLESFEFASFDVALDDVGNGFALADKGVDRVAADRAGALRGEPAHGGGGRVFEHHLARCATNCTFEDGDIRHSVQSEVFFDGGSVPGKGFDGKDILWSANPCGEKSVEANVGSQIPEAGAGAEGGCDGELLAQFVAAKPGPMESRTGHPFQSPQGTLKYGEDGGWRDEPERKAKSSAEEGGSCNAGKIKVH